MGRPDRKRKITGAVNLREGLDSQTKSDGSFWIMIIVIVIFVFVLGMIL